MLYISCIQNLVIDNVKYITKKYFKYFTYQIQMLQQICGW
jgi:hypothetical protein